jgi:hypothetical protein
VDLLQIVTRCRRKDRLRVRFAEAEHHLQTVVEPVRNTAREKA